MGDTDPATGVSIPSADGVLEMTGLSEDSGATCALLTPAIKARLRELGPGQVLEVRVDDRTAREDIASWSRLTGHALLAVIEEPPGMLRFYLRKKAD